MTDKQRERLAELRSANSDLLAQRALAKERERIADWISDFNEKYAFADTEHALKRVLEFVGGLPFKRPAWIDVERFSKRREFIFGNTDERIVWICFLSGSAELLRIVIGGRVCDYFADLDDWSFVCPFTVLVFDDLSGFIFIDDNGNMTEVIV